MVKFSFKGTKTLYGVEPSYFENMNFFEAIKERKRLAKKRLEEEVNKMLNCDIDYEEYIEILEKINAIKKAIDFNEFLLEEYQNSKK